MRRGRSVATAALRSLALLLAVAPPAHAQGWTAGYDAVPVFPDDFEMLGFDDLAPTVDGGVAFVANPEAADGTWPLVGRISSDGSAAQAWRLDELAPNAVIELADGSLVGAGLEGNWDRFALARILPDGTLAWARAFSGGFDYVTPPALTVDGAGRIVVAGMAVSDADGTCSVVLLDLDDTGTVLRGHEIEQDPSNTHACDDEVSLATTPDGLALSLGDSDSFTVVVRLDDARAVTGQWKVTECEVSRGLAAHADGSLDVACLAWNDRLVHVVRLEPGGAARWQVSVPPDGWAADLAAGPGGSTLVAATTWDGSWGDATWAAALDGATGAPLWTRHLLPRWEPMEPPRIARAAADGAFVAFTRSSAGLRDPGSELARLDAAGDVGGPCSSLGAGTAPGASALAVLPATHAIAPLAFVGQDLAWTAPAASIVVKPGCTAAGCEVDDGEPSDACGGLGFAELTLAAPRTGNHCEDADDWYVVRTCAGIPLVVTTSALGAASDTVLELWTWDCSTLLASDDDGGGGRASRLVHVPSTSGKAWIRVLQSDATVGPGREWTLTREPDACCCTSWELQLHGAVLFDRLLGENGASVILAAHDSDVSRIMRVSPGGDAVSGTRVAVSDALDADLTTMTGVGFDDVLVGGWLSPTGPGDTSWMALVRPDGSTAWSRTWAETISGPTHAAQLSGGTLLFSVITAPPERRRVIVLATPAGDVLRAIELAEDEVIQDVTPLDSGGFAIVGWVSGSARLTTFTPTGDVAWSRSFPALHSPEQVAQLGGGRIVTLLSSGTTEFLLAVEPDGSLAWSRELDITVWGDDLGRMADGTVMLVQMGGPPALVAVDDAGTTLWSTRGDNRLSAVWSSDVLPLRRHAGIFGSWFSTLSMRDTAGEVRGPCDNREAFPDPLLPAALGVTPAVPVVRDVAWTWNAGGVTSAPVAVPWSRGCADSTCPALSVVVEAPTMACAGASLALRAVQQGGCSSWGTHEWDLDWDGATFDVDATGAELAWTFPGGSATIAARFTGGEWPFATAIGAATITESSALVVVGPVTRCADDPCTTLEAPAGTSGWTWSTGETTSSICVSPVVDTTYSLQATGAGGCVLTGSHALDVMAPPVITFTQDCGPGVALVSALVDECPGCALAWSSGETVADVQVPFGETRTLVATSADGCASSADVLAITCLAPGEVEGSVTVSGPTGGGSGPIRVRIQQVPGATAYNVVGNAVGAWSAAGAPACHVRAWTELGGGWIELEVDVPAGWWFVATASNAAGEGEAGASSDGVERSSRPGWTGCGGAP